eukprot:gene19475-38840_t
MFWTSYAILIATICSVIVVAMPPIQISANVRGKRYDIEAETVEEVCKAVEEQAGLEAGQYSVLFRGKVLDTTDVLDKIGVAVGDTLNIVKGKRSRVNRSQDGEPVEDSLTSESEATGGLPSSYSGGMDQLKQTMENIDPEQMKTAMKRMDELLDSDFINDYFGDEERLEGLRQQML